MNTSDPKSLIISPMLYLIICLLVIPFYSCKHQAGSDNGFKGDKEAVQLANRMFEAIGGKEAWCELKSLYIKATHEEPQLYLPYKSEIWRGIDRFELVIEQQNDSFHVKAVVNDTAGAIRYYDQRDTVRVFNQDQINEWVFDHKHNIYVLLHDLACSPADYTVESDNNKSMLVFFKDSVYQTSFELDSLLRPHLFYVPNPDGSVAGSRFTHWSTHGGLVHSAGGHPLDSNFIYLTEIWQPSNKALRETFGEEVFILD